MIKPAAGDRPIAYSSPEAVQTTGTVAGEPPTWVVYSPLLPLFLLLFTGLYMFVLPYTTRWRSGRRPVGQV